MLKDTIRLLVHCTRSAKRGWFGKFSVLTKGESPVNQGCQIPNIRAKYAALGLQQRSGTFVEIGAFDGEDFSNTSFLADQGWRGLYVEPVADYCTKIKVRHMLNNVSTENVAIAETSGMASFILMGPRSTLSADTAAAYRTFPGATSEGSQLMNVKTDTLQAVLKKHSIPHEFDLLVIDVEGAEKAIVSSLLASPWKPSILIVELCDIHSDFLEFPDLQQNHREVREEILYSGYRQYYADHVNSIFVRAGRETAPEIIGA